MTNWQSSTLHCFCRQFKHGWTSQIMMMHLLPNLSPYVPPVGRDWQACEKSFHCHGLRHPHLPPVSKHDRCARVCGIIMVVLCTHRMTHDQEDILKAWYYTPFFLRSPVQNLKSLCPVQKRGCLFQPTHCPPIPDYPLNLPFLPTFTSDNTWLPS